MRRLNLVLLASLQLCSARQHAFNPFDDFLAHPRFQVVFSDTYIHEAEAQALVESSRGPNPTYAADFSQTDLTHNVRESTTADPASGSYSDADGDVDSDSPQVSETFEIIKTPHVQYLCSVPVIAPLPPLNQTATDLAKAEEARELSRASAKGWELMQGLEGTCLYFVDGWWSYSFCYTKESKEIVQFHALPRTKSGLPERDPESHEYVLGTTRVKDTQLGGKRTQKQPTSGQDNTPAAEGAPGATTDISQPPNLDLQVKGDQRYLIQRLDHGTICDLTGRARTIEVQYHCNPGQSGDRIGWIKEITTCNYVMVVHTSRLCADVAFLPPKEARAHPISCRQIVSSDEEAAEWRERKRIEAVESMAVADAKKARLAKGNDAGAAQESGINDEVISIGSVVVGGHQILGSGNDETGKPAAKIKAPSNFAAAAAAAVAKNPLAPLLEAVQKGEKGEKAGTETVEKVQIVTVEDLDKAGLDPETIEQFRKELKRLAQENGLFMVEHIDAEEDEEGNGDGTGQKKQKVKVNQGGTKGNGKKEAEEEEEEEGSQEVFFKEEL